MKKILTCFVILIILAALIAGGAYLWISSQWNQNVTVAANTIFEIKAGESTDTILNKLTDDKLIANKTATQIYLRLNSQYGAFKAGKFTLSGNYTLQQMLETLNKAPEAETADITIPEALRYTKILPLLKEQLTEQGVNLDWDLLKDIMDKPDQHKEKLSIKAANFLTTYKPQGKSIEGFLFPDTYNVHKDLTAQQLISLLVETLEDKLTNADWNAVRASKYSFYEILNIASMLEKEARTEVDFKIVAGIINNRIKNGMRLDIDATLLYGLNKDGSDTIFQSELNNTNNLYNTRRLTGFPPTPIANPGIISIRAALYPTINDYLYYITGKDLKMYYAKTYAEHQNNIARHL